MKIIPGFRDKGLPFGPLFQNGQPSEADLRQFVLARGRIKSSFPTEREAAILNCEATDVTPEELQTLFARFKREYKLSERNEEYGRVRKHYDHLIEDGEQTIRRYFGLENDYSVVVVSKDCVKPPPNRRPYGIIDGVPSSAWALLHAPEKANVGRKNVVAAIEWFESMRRYEEAEFIKAQYDDVINPSPAPPRMTDFEKRLLEEDTFVPDKGYYGAHNIRRCIARLKRVGFEEEAEFISKKYAWFIYDPEPPTYTAETERSFQRLMDNLWKR